MVEQRSPLCIGLPLLPLVEASFVDRYNPQAFSLHRMATELGVTAAEPVLTERCVVRMTEVTVG